MNRHERRARRARNRSRHNRFYRDYIRHLTPVPPDAPFDRGQVYHHVVFHDHWCRFYDRERVEDCDCDPIVKRYVEPRRS